MTIGGRISQKRKELALSQEALGEKLGISRQAIYKWESDSALPEIDKLVALSKLFGVSVGWLLGVEDAPAKADSGELTEKELQMVEEIVARYLEVKNEATREAQSEDWKKKLTSSSWFMVVPVVVLAICVGLIVSAVSMWQELESQRDGLAWSLNQMQSATSSQIEGLSDRIEEILRAQNSMLSEYDSEVADADLTKNTVTFSAKVTPKQWEGGITARFVVEDHQGGYWESDAEQGEGLSFHGEITAELSDSLSLSVVLSYPDGAQATQLLEVYTGLYSGSLPALELPYLKNDISVTRTTYPEEEKGDNFYLNEISDERWVQLNPTPEQMQLVNSSATTAELMERWQATAVEVKYGLFLNGELLCWAEELDEKYGGRTVLQFPEMDRIKLNGVDDVVHMVCFVRDNYGRVTARAKSEGWDDVQRESYPTMRYAAEATPLDLWTYPHDADGFPVEQS